jgi:hypothetical protein
LFPILVERGKSVATGDLGAKIYFGKIGLGATEKAGKR